MTGQGKHTPGPWVVAPSSNRKNGSGWRDIHSLGGAFSPAYVGEALERDAYLMAAAPELLEALKQLLAYRNENTAVHSGSLVWDDFVLPAIAKAEGAHGGLVPTPEDGGASC